MSFQKILMKKNLLQKNLFFGFVFLLLSCSNTPQQYHSQVLKDNPNRTLDKITPPHRTPTRKEGEILWNQKPELSEEQKSRLIRKNSQVPIDYQKGGVVILIWKPHIIKQAIF